MSDYWDKVWSRDCTRYNRHHREIWEAVVFCLKGRVADLGCGHCLLYKDKKIDLVGVDSSKKALLRAKENYPQGIFLLADASRTSLPSASFDTIVMFGLLDYYESWDEILNEARRLKKPDGKIFATLLNGYKGHDWTKYQHIIGNWYLYEE